MEENKGVRKFWTTPWKYPSFELEAIRLRLVSNWSFQGVDEQVLWKTSRRCNVLEMGNDLTFLLVRNLLCYLVIEIRGFVLNPRNVSNQRKWLSLLKDRPAREDQLSNLCRIPLADNKSVYYVGGTSILWRGCVWYHKYPRRHLAECVLNEPTCLPLVNTSCTQWWSDIYIDVSRPPVHDYSSFGHEGLEISSRFYLTIIIIETDTRE